jgi:hypothetical protein
MPANLHFFAHAKQVLRGLAPCNVWIENIPRASYCNALHCTYQTFAPTSHPPTKIHLRPSPPMTTPAPHTARRLMARSLTHYVLQLPQRWHMSQRPRERYPTLWTNGVVQQAAMDTPTHNSQYSFISKPTTQDVHTTHTNFCLTTHSHTLMPANLHFLAHAKQVLRGLAPCPIRIQNIQVPRTALHCIVPPKHSQPLHIHQPT